MAHDVIADVQSHRQWVMTVYMMTSRQAVEYAVLCGYEIVYAQNRMSDNDAAWSDDYHVYPGVDAKIISKFAPPPILRRNGSRGRRASRSSMYRNEAFDG